mmetsp:Transcript_134660/g.430066  ORF Transcript_134660/g.430066 Transcript_134660/m.430066 type:complete len:200 (-) Transcript_134660:783-1382(-)
MTTRSPGGGCISIKALEPLRTSMSSALANIDSNKPGETTAGPPKFSSKFVQAFRILFVKPSIARGVKPSSKMGSSPGQGMAPGLGGETSPSPSSNDDSSGIPIRCARSALRRDSASSQPSSWSDNLSMRCLAAPGERTTAGAAANAVLLTCFRTVVAVPFGCCMTVVGNVRQLPGSIGAAAAPETCRADCTTVVRGAAV